MRVGEAGGGRGNAVTIRSLTSPARYPSWWLLASFLCIYIYMYTDIDSRESKVDQDQDVNKQISMRMPGTVSPWLTLQLLQNSEYDAKS